MTSEFQVGDLCEGQNFVYSTRLNGMKCEVLTPLMQKEIVASMTGVTCEAFYHRVQFADGYVTLVRPERLRKHKDGEWALLKVANVIADAIIAA